MIELCPSSTWRPSLERAFDFAQAQVRALVKRDPDLYPIYTSNGRWRHEGEAWTRWCDGFLPGMMWIFHDRTGDPEWRQLAERYTTPLEPRKMDRDVHDLGFLFLSSYHRWYKTTGDQARNDVVIQAGRTLALRFKEKGQYMCSFTGPDSLFIDIMANVGIIFYAALETADKDLLHVAMQHCLTTRRVLIRGDGSSSHEGMFDLETGEFLRQTTQQGCRGDSCWSRGLAWAIYGFTSAYKHVRDARFLETAEACADFYIRETPANGVPIFDYDTPGGQERHLDSSAAAITAAGLLRLAKLTADTGKSVLYAGSARRMLFTLSQEPFLAKGREGWEGILAEAVYHLHKGLGVGESVMWGEYFYVEALDRALGDA